MEQHKAGDTDFVLEARNGAIVTLTLNRPQSYNALSAGMLAALEARLDALAADDSLRCVILGASGKAFCAGHDLKEMRAHPDIKSYRDLFAHCSRVMQKVVGLPVPVIARVQGLATAAGCQLVGSCDLAIAADHARFAVSGINVGLFCSTPAVALSRNIAPKRAFEMLVTGRFIDAATAEDWGLVNSTVAEAELDAATQAMANQIAEKSATAIRHGKKLFYRQRMDDLAQAYEMACMVMADNMMEEDAMEGIDAFIQKRPPRFKP